LIMEYICMFVKGEFEWKTILKGECYWALSG